MELFSLIRLFTGEQSEKSGIIDNSFNGKFAVNARKFCAHESWENYAVILQWGRGCFAGHSFKFQKRSQLFISMHNERLSCRPDACQQPITALL
jgi:hypothetical protein